MPETHDTPEATIIHLHWYAFVRDISLIAASVFFPPLIVVLFLNTLISGDVAVAVRHVLPLLGALWAIIVWMTMAIVWVRYYLSIWIITDKYVVYVNQINLFYRQVASWDFEHIESASFSADHPLSEALNFGTVWIKTSQAGESEYVVASPIPNPIAMGEAIASRIRTIGTQSTDQTEQAQGAEPQQMPTGTTQESSELIHQISHEMKGHLTRSQVTFAAIVAGDFGEVPEKVRDIASMALADSREGVETVMDILNSANLKKGTLGIERQTFDLLETVRQSVNKFKADASKRGIALRFKDKLGSCLIEGDEAKLSHHVFRNLIDNAIHYTPTGSIDIDLTWDMTHATFSIIDTGVGISAEDMTHLFTEGGKGFESTKINPGSTGYGLYVARMVVEGHNGKIWAESDGRGTGSRFFVKLPLHPSK